jgi:hypothetical protein
MSDMRRLLAAAVLVSLLRPVHVHAEPSSTPDPVEQHFQRGLAAARQGKFEEARRHYLEAWKLRKTHDVAANLGGAEFQLGAFRDAAEHLRYALDHLAASKATEKRDAMARDLEQAKQEIATLTVRVRPDNAKITLNGIALGVASALPSELYAEAGPVALRAELDGFVTDVRELTMGRGEQRTVELELVRDPASVAPAPAPSTSDPAPAPSTSPAVPDQKEQNLVPFGIGLGITAVAAGIGIGFAVDSGTASSDADSLLGSLEMRFGAINPCAPGRGASSGDCHELQRLRDRESRSADIANASFAIGSAAALFAIGAYFFWPKRNAEPAQSARLNVLVTREARGLAFTGRL